MNGFPQLFQFYSHIVIKTHVLGITCLLTMTKPSNGVHPIIVGEMCIDSQTVIYAFNFWIPKLQHISPHSNLELQPRTNAKQ
jgi:hypothetical protein